MARIRKEPRCRKSRVVLHPATRNGPQSWGKQIPRLRATIEWAKDYDLDLLTLPNSLPDFLITESLAHFIKKFHAIRVKSKEEALGHFIDIWDN
jgi:hypothetical protein